MGNPKELKREYDQTYYQKNKDKIRVRQIWFQENKNKLAQSRREYKRIYNTSRVDYIRLRGIKYRYDLSELEYSVMLMIQCGKCAMCQEVMASPQVDHDHKTGKNRALLCGKCNKGIRLLNEDSNLLRIAIDYLREVA